MAYIHQTTRRHIPDNRNLNVCLYVCKKCCVRVDLHECQYECLNMYARTHISTSELACISVVICNVCLLIINVQTCLPVYTLHGLDIIRNQILLLLSSRSMCDYRWGLDCDSIY
jgi:hypothetical protein